MKQETKYFGLYWVSGYKNYNQPFRRNKEHATFVFEDDEYFYFINLSSLNEYQARDTLRENNRSKIFKAKDVWYKKVKQQEYPLNLITLVARVNKETVETPLQDGTSRVTIKSRYKCSNKSDLEKEVFNSIIKSNNQFYVYNGNDDDYQYVDLDDEYKKLPEALIQELKKHSN